MARRPADSQLDSLHQLAVLGPLVGLLPLLQGLNSATLSQAPRPTTPIQEGYLLNSSPVPVDDDSAFRVLDDYIAWLIVDKGADSGRLHTVVDKMKDAGYAFKDVHSMTTEE